MTGLDPRKNTQAFPIRCSRSMPFRLFQEAMFILGHGMKKRVCNKFNSLYNIMQSIFRDYIQIQL